MCKYSNVYSPMYVGVKGTKFIGLKGTKEKRNLTTRNFIEEGKFTENITRYNNFITKILGGKERRRPGKRVWRVNIRMECATDLQMKQQQSKANGCAATRHNL